MVVCLVDYAVDHIKPVHASLKYWSLRTKEKLDCCISLWVLDFGDVAALVTNSFDLVVVFASYKTQGCEVVALNCQASKFVYKNKRNNKKSRRTYIFYLHYVFKYMSFYLTKV